MFSWLWGCMVLAFKVGVGSILWTISFWIVIGIFALIGMGIGAMMK